MRKKREDVLYSLASWTCKDLLGFSGFLAQRLLRVDHLSWSAEKKKENISQFDFFFFFFHLLATSNSPMLPVATYIFRDQRRPELAKAKQIRTRNIQGPTKTRNGPALMAERPVRPDNPKKVAPQGGESKSQPPKDQKLMGGGRLNLEAVSCQLCMTFRLV